MNVGVENLAELFPEQLNQLQNPCVVFGVSLAAVSALITGGAFSCRKTSPFEMYQASSVHRRAKTRDAWYWTGAEVTPLCC
jgi:fermentation-respiration switch protein FrsA (DUF1100 family)